MCPPFSFIFGALLVRYGLTHCVSGTAAQGTVLCSMLYGSSAPSSYDEHTTISSHSIEASSMLLVACHTKAWCSIPVTAIGHANI
jgi:hypothetical protein